MQLLLSQHVCLLTHCSPQRDPSHCSSHTNCLLQTHIDEGTHSNTTPELGLTPSVSFYYFSLLSLVFLKGWVALSFIILNGEPSCFQELHCGFLWQLEGPTVTSPRLSLSRPPTSILTLAALFQSAVHGVSISRGRR